MGATLWSRLQRLADRARDFVVANLARRAGPRLVVETVHTVVGKAVAPGADRVRADPKLRRDLFVLENACPLRHGLRRAVLARQCRQLALLHVIQHDRDSSSFGHSRLPV